MEIHHFYDSPSGEPVAPVCFGHKSDLTSNLHPSVGIFIMMLSKGEGARMVCLNGQVKMPIGCNKVAGIVVYSL